MAHPYTTRARLDALIRPRRMVALLDVDQDGLEDDEVFDDVIERAANTVDADLTRYYTVPFDAHPSTPGIVSDLTDYAAAVLLFELGGAPASEDARNFQARYDRLLSRIRTGDTAIPGATPATADTAVIGAVFDYEAPVVSGLDTSLRRNSDFIGS